MEILDIKKEILSLQNAKRDIALKIEDKILSEKIEYENIEVANAFRNATIIAEIFCYWADR